MKTKAEIYKFLEEFTSPGSLVVIGLGNPDRADDGVGIVLTSRLKLRYPNHVFSEMEKSVEGIVLSLLEREELRTFLFIDATDFGGKPGEVNVFTIKDAEQFIPALSTHKVPITFIMGLIVQKNKIPLLLGMQPESVEFLGEMSSSVIDTLNKLEKVLERFLSSKAQ